MSLHHSPETHQSLLARIPTVTGRELSHWFQCIEEGPSLMRVDERVTWLCEEHALSHAHARAIVHEHDLRRAQARA